MGYSEKFLSGLSIGLPTDTKKTLTPNITLNYTHFSVLFSRDRKLPLCSLVNFNGRKSAFFKRSKDKWKKEPKAGGAEINETFYKITNKEFQKGHIVRRIDPCWGAKFVAKAAEEDTFHYTNACPQHKNFNPRIWLELERNILEKGAVHHSRKISIFAGPVLHRADKPFQHLVDGQPVFIPSHFWKIVLWKKTDEKIYAVGFMQSQYDLIQKLLDQSYHRPKIRGAEADNYFEKLSFKNGAVYQVGIPLIEKITGLKFNFKGVVFPQVKSKIMELQVKQDFRKGFKSAFRSDSDKKPLIVTNLSLG